MRRVLPDIPKPDGRQRPLAVAALEDKIVQRAVVALLNAIYEEVSSESRRSSDRDAIVRLRKQFSGVDVRARLLC
jgi:retron-type reverse transcriptase